MNTKRMTTEAVTVEQKYKLLQYINQHREMISLNSNAEQKKILWEDLTRELNRLRPEKSIESWKRFWRYWRSSVEAKPDHKLTFMDLGLKGIISNLETHPVESLTFDQINYNLEQIQIQEAINTSRIEELENIIREKKDQIKEIKKDNENLKKKKFELLDRKWNMQGNNVQ